MPSPGNPQALNRYAYVLNNPLKYTDPTGHYVFENDPDKDRTTSPGVKSTKETESPGYFDQEDPNRDHWLVGVYNQIRADANPFRPGYGDGNRLTRTNIREEALKQYAKHMKVGIKEAEEKLRVMAKQGKSNPYNLVGVPVEAMLVNFGPGSSPVFYRFLGQFPGLADNLYNFEPTYLEMLIEAHPKEFNNAMSSVLWESMRDIYENRNTVLLQNLGDFVTGIWVPGCTEE